MNGTWSNQDWNLPTFPLAAFVAMISLAINISLSLAIKFTRITLVLPFNQQNQVTLGSLLANFLTHLILFIMSATIISMNRIQDPSELNQYPRAFLVHCFFHIFPSTLVMTQFAYFFFSNNQLRNSIKNIIFS